MSINRKGKSVSEDEASNDLIKNSSINEESIQSCIQTPESDNNNNNNNNNNTREECIHTYIHTYIGNQQFCHLGDLLCNNQETVNFQVRLPKQLVDELNKAILEIEKSTGKTRLKGRIFSEICVEFLGKRLLFDNPELAPSSPTSKSNLLIEEIEEALGHAETLKKEYWVPELRRRLKRLPQSLKLSPELNERIEKVLEIKGGRNSRHE